MLADLLREAIGDRSHAVLARAIGVDRSAISHWLGGGRPTPANLAMLLDECVPEPGSPLRRDIWAAFGVPVGDLHGGSVPDTAHGPVGAAGPSQVITGDNACDDPTEETQDPPDHVLPAMRAAGWTPRVIR